MDINNENQSGQLPTNSPKGNKQRSINRSEFVDQLLKIHFAAGTEDFWDGGEPIDCEPIDCESIDCEPLCGADFDQFKPSWEK